MQRLHLHNKAEYSRRCPESWIPDPAPVALWGAVLLEFRWLGTGAEVPTGGAVCTAGSAVQVCYAFDLLNLL